MQSSSWNIIKKQFSAHSENKYMLWVLIVLFKSQDVLFRSGEIFRSSYLTMITYVVGITQYTSLTVELGPVVQSVVSLTSSLRVISLTVLAYSICNILIFFAEKM